MKPTIYIFVEGGVVQEVRCDQEIEVKLVDYDDEDGYEHIVKEAKRRAAMEKDRAGDTYEKIEKRTKDYL